MSQFDITYDQHSNISGEYRSGSPLVIFSHGFDVRRDSNGLFRDIVSSLPVQYGYVLFDYHHYYGTFEKLRPLSDQALILNRVVQWAKTTIPAPEVHLIAHSMGCTIASYAANMLFDSIIYLAPPVHSGSGLRKFFTNHPGRQQHSSDLLIQRRSGKSTLLSERFLQEFESADPTAFARKYSSQGKHIHIIAALNDRFIPAHSYEVYQGNKNFTITCIPGDHNFSGADRNLLIQKILANLQGRRRAM